MAKKTVRTGMIGAGFSAAFHYEALQKVACVDVEVVGVYARRPERAEPFAQKRGIRYFDRLEALLEAVDVVHICTPPYAHAPLSIAALEQNKYVVCEKPLTGYFGDGSPDFHWDRADMELARAEALAQVQRLLEA
jgi:predicted dehydrogenase